MKIRLIFLKETNLESVDPSGSEEDPSPHARQAAFPSLSSGCSEDHQLFPSHAWSPWAAGEKQHHKIKDLVTLFPEREESRAQGAAPHEACCAEARRAPKAVRICCSQHACPDVANNLLKTKTYLLAKYRRPQRTTHIKWWGGEQA